MDLPSEPPQVNPDRVAWRKNIPYIYHSLITIAIPWPSLTVQWLPEVKTTDNSQELVLGTRTSGQNTEYLRFGRLEMPNPQVKNLDTFDPDAGTFGSFSSAASTDFEIVQRIDHPGEVHKARYMPQNPNLIGTISSTGQVSVFDRTKYPLNPCGTVAPSISLAGHTDEGFAITWCPQTEGLIASGSNDSKINVWDLKSQYRSGSGSSLDPNHTLTFHSKAVNDVKWHPHNTQLLASASDDHFALVSDWRSPVVSAKVNLEQPVYSVALNPSNEFLLAAGCQDGSIHLIDIRTGAKLHKLQSSSAHSGSVTALEWNKKHTAVLASGSTDSFVNIWDTSRISDGKEHKFKHAGHTAPVADIDWNPAYDMVLASIGEDNALHVWEPVW